MQKERKNETQNCITLCVLIFDHVSSMSALLNWLYCDTTCL